MKRKIIILLAILFLSTALTYSAYYDGLTRSEIRVHIRDALGDTDTSNTYNLRWSSTTLNNRIEVAQIEIVARTRCLRSRVKCDSVQNQEEYILPNDCMAIERVCIQISGNATDYVRLDWATVDKWDDGVQWEDDAQGIPSEWALRRGGERLILNPPPNSDYAGTNKLRIDFVEIPDQFADDNSVPFNSARRLYPFHQLIIWYVSAWCKMDEEKFKEADYYWGKYENDIKRMVEILAIQEAQRGGIRPKRMYE